MALSQVQANRIMELLNAQKASVLLDISRHYGKQSITSAVMTAVTPSVKLNILIYCYYYHHHHHK